MQPHANGHIALVTGGARGIGEAIAPTLASDGFSVVVADLRRQEAEATAAAIRKAGGDAIAVELDVTSTESVSAGLAAAREASGLVDVLVNNAGWDDLKPFVETDEPFWDRVIEVNFKGALRLTQGAAGDARAPLGRIISIGSDAARVGSSLESVYSGAKGGVSRSPRRSLARPPARASPPTSSVQAPPTRHSCAK